MIKQIIGGENAKSNDYVRVPYESVEQKYMTDIMNDTHNNKMMDRMESEIVMRKSNNDKRLIKPYRDKNNN